MLVDAGKELPDMGKLVVEPQLKALGLTKVDYVVATHPDEDHIGGIPWIMENFKIGSLIEPWNLGIDNPIMARIHRLALSHGVPVIKAIENSDIEGSSVQVRILNPSAGVIAGDLADNNKSVVLSVSMSSFSCLLMADAEIPVENRLLGEHEVHKITVLKVGHHGSHTSSQEAFLKQTAPQISVISCGRHNRFGHPNPEVLHRLTQNSQEIFRTDEDGAVRITTDGNTWKAISAASGN
jgi:competence protein ComEC